MLDQEYTHVFALPLRLTGYHQCTMCEGQGIQWWNEVDYEEEPYNCGELDAMLYANETEADEDTCREVISDYTTECW